MSKHRGTESEPTFIPREKNATMTSAAVALVLTLILGALGLSLQSPSDNPVLSETPAVAAEPFDQIPDDALTPIPAAKTDTATKEASPSPPATNPPSNVPSPSAAKPEVEPEAAAPAPPPPAPPPPPPPAPPPPVAVQPAPASAPNRITYPSAGIDVAIYPLGIDQSTQASQSIVPPLTLDGYWLSPFGTPGSGSTNTTYIVGHSWDDRDAPFNRLSSHAMPGDTFSVTTGTGVLTYRVDSVVTHLKSTLKDSDIWTGRPNVIVLISCYTDDPWGKNVVVTASPVP